VQSDGDSSSKPTNSGRFQKGHPKYGGRQRGVPNKFGRDVKGWLLAAAEELGADGHGKGGGKGFVKSVGLTKGEALLAALVRQLPPAKDDAAATNSGAPSLKIEIYSVPRGSTFDPRTGLVTCGDGSPGEVEPFTPYQATPPLPELLSAPEPAPAVEQPAPVIDLEAEPAVTRLDSWRDRKRDDGPGAA
jgi:hypothetical protein